MGETLCTRSSEGNRFKPHLMLQARFFPDSSHRLEQILSQAADLACCPRMGVDVGEETLDTRPEQPRITRLVGNTCSAEEEGLQPSVSHRLRRLLLKCCIIHSWLKACKFKLIDSKRRSLNMRELSSPVGIFCRCTFKSSDSSAAALSIGIEPNRSK